MRHHHGLLAALACYYHRIAFGHVEAGIGRVSAITHFPRRRIGYWPDTWPRCISPPRRGHAQPRARGDRPDDRPRHGHTVIDALLMTAGRQVSLPVIPSTSRYLLVTAHRRENFGEPLQQICMALRDLVDAILISASSTLCTRTRTSAG